MQGICSLGIDLGRLAKVGASGAEVTIQDAQGSAICTTGLPSVRTRCVPCFLVYQLNDCEEMSAEDKLGLEIGLVALNVQMLNHIPWVTLFLSLSSLPLHFLLFSFLQCWGWNQGLVHAKHVVYQLQRPTF